MLKTLSLRARLIGSILAVTVVGNSAILYFDFNSQVQDAERAARQAAQDIAAQYAAEVRDRLGEGRTIARTVGRMTEGLIEREPVDREGIVKASMSLVAKTPGIFATTVVVEPNSFDGNDAAYIGTPYSDQTGRFIPYFVRAPNKSATLELLDMSPEGNPEIWYHDPIRSGQERVLAPFTYQLASGKTIFMTTVAVPIFKNGKAIGVSNVDWELEELQTYIRELRPLGVGRIELLSNAATWVGHRDVNQLGKETKDPLYQRIAEHSALDQRFVTTIDAPEGRLLLASAPVRLGNAPETWSVIASIPLKALLTDINSRFTSIISMTLLIVGIVLVLLAMIGTGIVRPIRTVTETMTRLATGDYSAEIKTSDRQDEVGAMTRSVAIFRDRLIEMDALRQRQSEMEQTAAETRRQTLQSLTGEFDRTIRTVVTTVSGSTQVMHSSAEDLTAIAQDTARQAGIVEHSTGKALGSVQAATAASTDLFKSIAAVNASVAQATSVAREAVEQSSRTSQAVQNLAAATTRIGEVVQLINAIAAQTNLLALNATIEAARAGDAGKGFAVVASEVKQLANQTAKATEEIQNQITDVQSESEKAVGAISGIGATIERISEITGSVAKAIEEQGISSQAIVQNVQKAAAGVSEATDAIGNLVTAANVTGQNARQMLNATSDLTRQAGKMSEQIDHFIGYIRRT